MKRILLSAVLLLACGAVQAQFNIRVYNMSEVLKAKPIDKVLFTAQYDLSFVGDTAHEDKHIDETMMLKVGSKSSLFYSYARFRMAESVVTVTGRRWSYGDGHTYCTLDVEVRN